MSFWSELSLSLHFRAFTIKAEQMWKALNKWMNSNKWTRTHTSHQQSISSRCFQKLVSRLSHAIKDFYLVTGHCEHSEWPFPLFLSNRGQVDVCWVSSRHSADPTFSDRGPTGVQFCAGVYDNLCEPLILI